MAYPISCANGAYIFSNVYLSLKCSESECLKVLCLWYVTEEQELKVVAL